MLVALKQLDSLVYGISRSLAIGNYCDEENFTADINK